MHPDLKQAARAYLDAQRTYQDKRRQNWPYSYDDMPQYIAMLDAMCDLCTAARMHYPFLYQRDRFHRHIARLARSLRFDPFPGRNYKPANQWG